MTANYMEASQELAPLLPSIPQDVSSKEGMAFGHYIQIEGNQPEKAEPIKSLMKEKEIKKLTEKAIGIFREDQREKTKFIPKR